MPEKWWCIIQNEHQALDMSRRSSVIAIAVVFEEYREGFNILDDERVGAVEDLSCLSCRVLANKLVTEISQRI